VPERPEGGEVSYDAEGRLRWGKRAAGLLIQREDSKDFLLVLRSNEVMDPGLLGIPGGRVEPGEELDEAAISETTEELGPLPPVKIVASDTYESGDFSYVTFLAKMKAKDAKKWKPVLNWENDAWIWVNLKELNGIDGIHPNVLRVLQKWS